MIATLRFNLSDPDDACEHRYALAGRDALIALEQIDQWARGRLKHGTPSTEATHDLEAVRAMVPHDLVNLLH
jgi:hypothetical protein